MILLCEGFFLVNGSGKYGVNSDKTPIQPR